MKNLIMFFLLSFFVVPAWAEFEDCDAKLSSAIGKLLASDTKGILALQFKITTLKATKHLIGTTHPTLESTLAADKEKLKAFNEADPAVMKKLADLFDKNGGDKHTEALKARVVSLKAKTKDALYWKADKRLSNEDVSTYLMMDKISNPQSDVNEQDIAVTWYMNKVSENIAQTKGRNSGAHNVSLLSVQLARNLGQIRGIASVSAAQADAQIAAAQTTINDFLSSSLATIKQQIPECFKDEKFKGTQACDISFLNASLSSFLVNLEDVKTLIAPVAKTEATTTTVAAGAAALVPGEVATAGAVTAPLTGSVVTPGTAVPPQTLPIVVPAVTTPLAGASLIASPPARSESSTVRRPAAVVHKKPKHHADPQRKAFTSLVVNALFANAPTRVTCPSNQKVINVKTTDLNNGGSVFRYTIVTAGKLDTLKRDLASDKQISCMKNLVLNQCYPDVKVDRATCFY